MISGRYEAITIAQQKLELMPIYLDTETTGLDRYSEIVEVCVVDHSGEAIFQSLVKPLHPIPADVIRIHGITNEMVKDSPSWPLVWPDLLRVIRGRVVGIYNAEYDLRLIQQSNSRYGLPSRLDTQSSFFCIMKLFAQFFGEWDRSRGTYRWQSLDTARKYFNIPIPNSHRAHDDTQLARRVLLYIAGRENE